ncbi:unnamed protein product [Prorocentrum cordatum]|uniref:Reverse transcriptase domain-containing protein n=1 Tax=Prorocentrum cordatum TaxID=2364126 RepID=A0ABN9TY79_9DINO|nr:unnamed protein product [Polarella glacialis]
MPPLLTFDFQQAFASVAHDWIRLVLSRSGLPKALCGFFGELFLCVHCLAATGVELSVLNCVQSGIMQECQGSGFLFAIGADPLMQDQFLPLPAPIGRTVAALLACL